MKIVVLDGYCVNPGDLSWKGLEALGSVEVYEYTTPGEVLERSRGAGALLTNKVRLNAETLAALPELKYIGVLATGYNVIDLEAARRQGITLTNVPAYSTRSVAQLVFAHLLNITQQVGHHAARVSEGAWSRSRDFCFWDTPQIELSGKTMGIVGFGNIGSAVAELARAFGMNVLAYTSKEASRLPLGVEKVTLDELFSRSDVVSLHAPLTPETRGLVDAARLALMKQTAILINTGRGPLVDETALAEALNSGKIYAAGLDVLSSEPPREDNPLLTARNCYVTPHIAWATREARSRLIEVAVTNLGAFLSGHPVNRVD